MTVYEVYSRDRDGLEQWETRRTDRRAAEEDVNIIKTIFGRGAWIVETDAA